MQIRGIEGTFESIDRKYDKIDKGRKVVSTADKAVILGAAALSARSVVKHENSSIKNALSGGVNAIAGAIKGGIQAADKKDTFKRTTGLMEKVLEAPAKNKALAVIGAVAGLFMLHNIKDNSRAKGIVEQAREDSKLLAAQGALYEQAVIPKVVKDTERKTKEEIAFGVK